MITLVNGNEVMIAESVAQFRDGDSEMFLLRVTNKMSNETKEQSYLKAPKLKNISKKKSTPKGKPVICTDNNMHFFNAFEAADTFFPEGSRDWNAIKIRECCQGKRENVDGMHFKYVNDEEQKNVEDTKLEETATV